MSSPRRGVLLCALLVGVAGVACAWPRGTEPHPVQRLPPPTEHVLDEDAEEENHEKRDAWIEQLHRAPPGIDWRLVEAENARASIARRRAAVRGGRAAGLGQWVERGSENLAGSMYSVVRSSDGQHLLAGAALGGMWRAAPDGTGWTPLGDGLYGGVHHLVVVPSETGGPDAFLTSPTWGRLVFRSEDDGRTWDEPAGIPPDTFGVRDVARSTDGSGAIWMLAQVGWYGEGVVLRSLDGGWTFEEVGSTRGAWGDLWVPRDGTGGVWVLASDAVLVSYDLGATWEERPLPTPLGIGLIAGSEATDPPRLWVAEKSWYGPSHLWRTDDGGASWVDLGFLDDHWDVLTASIVDPDLLVYGGVELHRSRDGGATFARVNRWDEYYGDPLRKLHADIMAATVAPDPAGETWYLGTHGGVYTSTDGVATVTNLSTTGLRVGQYYSSLTSWSDPARILVGSQDQGLQWGEAIEWEGLARWDLVQHTSGDFGHLVSHDGTHDLVFTVYPGILLVFEGQKRGKLSWYDFPPDPTLPPWLPVLVADPEDPEAVFFLAGRLWRYRRTDDGGFEAKQWSDHDFDDEDGEFLSALAFTPAETDRAFAITSTGRVFRSEDRGKTWSRSGGGLPSANWYYGTSLVISRLDPDVIYVGGSGYGGPAVYRTTDGGESWEPWSEGLPPTLVYTLVEVRDGTGRVMVGTETAAYLRELDGDAWIDVTGTSAPITQYWSAEVVPHEATVRFATYARGIWDFRLEPQGEGCWALRDDDADGHACEVDCDDADPTSFPEAPDACDGRDADCDGTPEPDDDADGFPACGECDDADAARFPGAPERECDGIDQDCSGADLCTRLGGAGGCGCGPATGSAGYSWAPGLAALAILLRSRVRSRRGPPGE